MRYGRIMLAALLVAGVLAGAAYAGGIRWAHAAGVTCGFGAGPQGRGVACSRTDGTGYAVTLTRTRVIVWRHGRAVFERRQP